MMKERYCPKGIRCGQCYIVDGGYTAAHPSIANHMVVAWNCSTDDRQTKMVFVATQYPSERYLRLAPDIHLPNVIDVLARDHQSNHSAIISYNRKLKCLLGDSNAVVSREGEGIGICAHGGWVTVESLAPHLTPIMLPPNADELAALRLFEQELRR